MILKDQQKLVRETRAVRLSELREDCVYRNRGLREEKALRDLQAALPRAAHKELVHQGESGISS